MKFKDRLKAWAPYIMSDGLMYIIMFVVIGLGVLVMVIFKL